uniref:RRM domain-containing protein n=1 Tax=Oryza rufipogon TaxID=4529 RepID=A0A0E0NLY5_ORYRU
MARLYVGNLDPRVTSGELEDEFRVFGVLRSVWVARKPPGFAFIDFDDKRDAEDALRDLDEATVLVIALQGAAVFHQFVGAATAGHHVAENLDQKLEKL